MTRIPSISAACHYISVALSRHALIETRRSRLLSRKLPVAKPAAFCLTLFFQPHIPKNPVHGITAASMSPGSQLNRPHLQRTHERHTLLYQPDTARPFASTPSEIWLTFHPPILPRPRRPQKKKNEKKKPKKIKYSRQRFTKLFIQLQYVDTRLLLLLNILEKPPPTSGACTLICFSTIILCSPTPSQTPDPRNLSWLWKLLFLYHHKALVGS